MPRPEPQVSRTRAQPRKAFANKHPGYAAIASALIWGSGQIYADRLVPGLSFLWLQGVTLAGLFLVSQHASQALDWIHQHVFGESGILIGAVAGSFLIASLWFFNVLQAYRFARMRRRDPYTGSDSLYSVIFCGTWMPGLGQFLNAQFRKGASLLLVSTLLMFTGLASMIIMLCWPYLQEGESLFWGEIVFIAFGFSAMLYTGTLLVGFYDAIQVNLFPEKRASYFKRMQWAINRLRRAAQLEGAKVFIRPVVRNIIFALSLILVLNASRYFFPIDFYSHQVSNLSSFLLDNRLTFSASLVNRGNEKFVRLIGQEATLLTE